MKNKEELLVAEVAFWMGLSRQRVSVLVRSGRLLARQLYPHGPYLVSRASMEKFQRRPGGRPKTKK